MNDEERELKQRMDAALTELREAREAQRLSRNEHARRVRQLVARVEAIAHEMACRQARLPFAPLSPASAPEQAV